MARKQPIDPIIEDALYIKDKILANKDTKDLMQWIYARLETRFAMVANDMSEGTREESEPVFNNEGDEVSRKFITVPLTHSDYCTMSGMCQGLKWLRGEIESLIMKANEYEKEREKK